MKTTVSAVEKGVVVMEARRRFERRIKVLQTSYLSDENLSLQTVESSTFRPKFRSTVSRPPLCIDLYAGLGGWSEGFLAEGYDVIGFDIERHVYGEHRYPAQLVLQDVLTLHGAQFKDAACIVASPPCQKYSWMAMPWSLAKARAAEIRADETGVELEKLNALFNACFRIQREASEAAGHHIPMVVENVKGAQPWVGPAKWHYGSFYLWGDVPALMPFTHNGVMKHGVAHRSNGETNFHGSAQRAEIKNNGGSWFAIGSPGQTSTGQNPVNICKVPGMNFHEYEKTGKPGRSFQSAAVNQLEGVKQRGSGAAWFDKALDERRKAATATKNGGDWFSSGENCSLQRRASSKSSARKAASAQIAKIPLPLASHIARCFRPC